MTLPLELDTVADLQSVLDAAHRLPLVSCAFCDCSWRAEPGGPIPEGVENASESPWEQCLRDHVLQQHGAHIQQVADVTEKWIWDVYKQALAVKEREGIPAVGAAIDRRAFENTLQCYNDESIKALICFSCARVCLQSGGPRSHIEFVRGGWFLALPAGSMRKNFSKASIVKGIRGTGVRSPFRFPLPEGVVMFCVLGVCEPSFESSASRLSAPGLAASDALILRSGRGFGASCKTTFLL